MDTQNQPGDPTISLEDNEQTAAHHGDFDTPLAGLPTTTQQLLTRNQLELALVEVRFVGSGATLDPEQGLAVRDRAKALGLELPVFEPAERQEVNFVVSPGGGVPSSSTGASVRGWQYTDSSGSMTATVMPDTMAIHNNGHYRRYSESLGEPLRIMLAATNDALQIQLVNRIGLRYVNRLVDMAATNPSTWIGRIHPAVLGVAGSSAELGWHVTSAHQQVDLGLEGRTGALLRHGVFKDPGSRGAYSYLLDIDVFDTDTAAFAADAVLARAQTLNRTALALFQQIVMPDFRDTMGAQPLNTEGQSP
jgi:uncharacterized protein (TIGR04255 family)